MNMTWFLADALTNMETTAVNFITKIRPYVWIMVAIALIIAGFWFGLGGEESKQKAKKTLLGVIIGSILILGATEISRFIIGNIAF